MTAMGGSIKALLAVVIFFCSLFNVVSADTSQISSVPYSLSKQEYAALRKLFPDLKLADCNKVENKFACLQAQLHLAYEAWKFRYILADFPLKERVEKGDFKRFEPFLDRSFKLNAHEENRRIFWDKGYLELDACLEGQCSQGIDPGANINNARGAWRGANEFLACLNSKLPRKHGNVELSHFKYSVNRAVNGAYEAQCSPVSKSSILLITRILRTLR